MKPNSLYAQLELITDPYDQQRLALGSKRTTASDYSISRAWALARARFGPWASALLDYFCGSTNLRITVKRDRQGYSQFVAYDPITQQRHTFSSEPELRVWLDRRYYQ